jgi:PilZ domain
MSNQGFASKAAATPFKPAVEPRRERRLHVAVPVKVFPDAAGVEFQTCCTYEISTVGARLVAPQGIKTVGQIVVLQRHNRRAKYKVIWIGKPDTSEAGQVGLETLEPSNVIWESEIRMRLAKA